MHEHQGKSMRSVLRQDASKISPSIKNNFDFSAIPCAAMQFLAIRLAHKG